MTPQGRIDVCEEIITRKLNFVAIVILACAAYANQAMGQTSISTAGMIESTSGGIKFPDGTVQSSAADDDLSARVAELEATVVALENLLESVTRGIDPNTGYETIQFSGMNVQIVSGLGFTDIADGTGNLIIGYNEWREWEGSENLRDGSHMLVVGSQNNYTAESFGGIVVGTMNQTSANFASVSGGVNNYALNNYASISGGDYNVANGHASSITGGQYNVASGGLSSISGGFNNTASGANASVSGGNSKTAAVDVL
jgi:hypothetical protein